MDIEAAEWDTWEHRFLEVAEHAQKVPKAPSLNTSQHYLCLYGENGLTPEEELNELATMADSPEQLKRLDVDTDYWQDIVLFIP